MGCSSSVALEDYYIDQVITTRMVPCVSSYQNQISWILHKEYRHMDIQFAKLGLGLCIFGNHDTQRYYATGDNSKGQLGVGKFENDDMKHKIFEITLVRDNNIQKLRKYS